MSEPIVLAPRLDLSAAQGLLSLSTDAKNGDVILDMSDVTYLGALCLQVLLAAGAATRAAGHSFELANVSDRVTDQLRVMGFTPEDIEKGQA